MSRYLTNRSLLSLLTAAMLCVQSLGFGCGARCGADISGCAADREAVKTCCGSGGWSCCSTKTGRGCCCGGSAGTQCGTACTCGEHDPKPAIPGESQSQDDLRHLIADIDNQMAMPSIVTPNQRPTAADFAVRPIAKAGVNAMLCVRLT